jgi:hypothetical protein
MENNPPYPPNSGNPYQNPQGNPYQQNPYQQGFGGQRDVSNATAILVLGIISIVTAFCYGIPGIGCGIAALIMGNKAKKEYEANPSMYTESSWNNAKAGRICGIIGLILGGLMLLVVVLYFIFVLSMFGAIAGGMAN